MKRIVVAITGASGAAYARRLLQRLAEAKAEIHLIMSPHGRQLIADELGIASPSADALVGRGLAKAIATHEYEDVGALPATGSFLTDGMLICPCSINTLGQIAAGTAANLISRAAAVHLKEARRLVLLVREMPISQIDLGNMLRVSQAGGIICPASPGFYAHPKEIGDLVDFVAGRLCDLVGVAYPMTKRWTPPQ